MYMARFAREEFTPEQKERVIHNIKNEYTALSLYESGLFDMEKRTFYRRYRDVKAELGILTRPERKWESSEKRELQALANSGLSRKDINIEGRSKGAIKNKCARDGIDVKSRKYKPWAKEETEILIKLRSQGMSVKNIEETGLLPGRSRNDIYQKLFFLRKQGIIHGNTKHRIE